MTVSPIVAYVMKGTINEAPYHRVQWKVFNTPDLTGEFSGFSNLIDIVVDYTIVNKAAVEEATTVQFSATGEAGGDLDGNYPDPDVVKLHGHAISSSTPTNQQTLLWNSITEQWEPSTPLSGPPSGAASGDLSGLYPGPTVVNINGTSVPASPSANQVLKASSGTTATWTTIDNNSVTAAAGIVYSKLNLTGGIVNADVNASAAIAGTKISPAFGSQNISTTGTLSAGATTITGATISGLSTGVVHSNSSGVLSSSTIVNADVSSSAAIAYSKLNLSNSIVNADVNSSAAIAYSKLNLANSIVNADVNSSAAITYSKLNLTGGIVNADVNAAAAIDGSKIYPHFGLVNVSGGNISMQSGLPNLILGAIRFTRTTVSSDYIIDSTNPTDWLILADTSGGSFNVTLPSPTDARFLVIKDATQSFGTNNLTIVRNGSEKIDNVAADYVADIDNQEIILTSDGTDWFTQGEVGAAGPAGGDLSGTYPNPSVIALRGKSLDSSLATIGTLEDGYRLTWDDADGYWYAAPDVAIPTVTWANDLDTSTDASQNVVSLTGSSSVVNMKARDLIWLGSTANPFIGQSSASGSGTQFLIKSQEGISGDGGTLALKAGDGSNNGGEIIIAAGAGSNAGGHVNIYAGSGPIYGNIGLYTSTKSIVIDNTGYYFAATSTGIGHFDSSGKLTSSNIVNADIDSAAAIAVSKLAAGTANQVLINSAAPTPTWYTLSGDVTNVLGVMTVGAINGTTVTTAGGALTTGQVLRVTGVASSDWGALDLSNASAVTGALPVSNQVAQTMAGDVTGTTAASTVVKINSTSVPDGPNANDVLVAITDSAAVWSHIYDGYVASNANIAVSKLAAGTAGQLLLNNSTPTPTWTSMSADATISSAGAVEVVAVRNNAYKDETPGASQDGYVPTWVNSNSRFEILPQTGGSGTSFTAGGDLSGSAVNQTVIGLRTKSLASSLSSIGSDQDGYVLTWVNGSSDWEALPPLSAKYKVSSAVTVNYTIQHNDEIIQIGTLTSSITLTLPSSPSTGEYHIIKTGASCYQFLRNDAGSLTTVGQTVTITPASGNIDGQSSWILSTPYASLEVYYNGSEWSII